MQIVENEGKVGSGKEFRGLRDFGGQKVMFWSAFQYMFFLLVLFITSKCTYAANEDKNPLFQSLPDCTRGYSRLTKKTSSKALACPMIKDEEGFLSEWVAYYTIHGFDHIMFFDDGSTDNGGAELKPWIEKGIVSIRYTWYMTRLSVNKKE